MAYLVDGNNVMAQRVGWHKNKPGARRILLEELARFARERSNKLMVAFDGAPDPYFPDGSTFKGVRIFYAVRGSNADERIKEIVEATRERRTLIVVTSDRALAGYVRRCGVRVMRSGDFSKQLEATRGQSRSSVDPGEPAPEETSDWMRYFGVDSDDE
jgi:predicted RNA-binding protein with PIN domain